MTNHIEGWCVLRTRGVSTMRLAASLTDSGIAAWTPIGSTTKRKGRARDRVDSPTPIMPTFVFARSSHIGELQRLRGLLVSPHPAFSIFRHLNRVPIISDRDICSLKDAEEQSALNQRKKQRTVVPVGSQVNISEGAFAGMSGVVEQSDGKSAIVAFGGNFKVTIAAWLLPQDLLEASVSNSDIAA